MMADEPKVEPKVEPAVKVPVVEPKPAPVEYSAENLPKTKGEWDTLKAQDLSKWGELTQMSVDKLYRHNKELREEKATSEAQIQNFTVQLESQQKPQFNLKVPDTPQDFSRTNLPQSKEQWDDLAIDNPTLHADLRYTHNVQQQTTQVDFESAQIRSRKTVQVEHPDMYLSELDEKGDPKKDDQGKIILKIDSNNGEPIFNPNSEKGKLWNELYLQDPNIEKHQDAPELLMMKMERALKLRGQKMVDDARTKEVNQNQVVADGVPPPPKTNFVYDKEQERESARKGIERGTYVDEADYFANRDNTGGIYDENRMPDFSKKPIV